MRVTLTIPDTWAELTAKQAALLQAASADYREDGQYPDYVAKAAYILTDGQIVPGEYHILPGSQQMQIEEALRGFLAQEREIIKGGSLAKTFAGYAVPQTQGDFMEATGTKFWADMATYIAGLPNQQAVTSYDSAIYACAAWLVSRKYGQPDALLESEAIGIVERMPAGEVLPVGFYLAVSALLLTSSWQESQMQLKRSLEAVLATLPSSGR